VNDDPSSFDDVLPTDSPADSHWAIAPHGGRLDSVLAGVAGVSRTQVQAWLESGIVRVNSTVSAKGSLALRGGETLTWTPPPPAPSLVRPEAIPLTVLFEDEYLIAVDKPAGMLTHPAGQVVTGTLVNALLGRVPLALEGEDFGIEGYRPGIVHRLDQDTSGVIVVAKTRDAHARLAQMFADRRTNKQYLAITERVPPSVTLEVAIGRHPVAKTRMAVGGSNSRDAKTDFTVLASAPEVKPAFALVKARIYTGRTHQIRVHLQHLKTPILGDAVYGKPSPHIKRQALHAYKLEFTHPITHLPLVIQCSPPEDFVGAWLAVGGVWQPQSWGLEPQKPRRLDA
jgi:23S rRNA pseudouridine1911/1915/1917 synthase